MTRTELREDNTMNKETYIKAIIEIIEFEPDTNVVTASENRLPIVPQDEERRTFYYQTTT